MPRLTTVLDRLRLSRKNKRTPSALPLPPSLTIAVAAPLSPIMTFDELFEKYQLPRLREQIAACRELPEVTANGNLVAAMSIDEEQNQVQAQVQAQEHAAPLASNPVWQKAGEEKKKVEETKDESESEDDDEGWVKYMINLVELEEGVLEVVLEKVEGTEETEKK